jgi:hypothetical protein
VDIQSPHAELLKQLLPAKQQARGVQLKAASESRKAIENSRTIEGL